MANNKVDDFFKWVKNNKFLAPLVIVSLIILSIVSFVEPVSKFIDKLLPVNYSDKIDISLTSYNPAFTGVGEILNWGGGSQSLFVNCEEKHCELNEISNLNNYEVWETCQNGSFFQFKVSAIYNAPSNYPNCVIEGWGLQLTKSYRKLKNGIFIDYLVGGADAIYEQGKCLITHYEGDFSISMNYEKENKNYEKPTLKYFKPNDVLAYIILASIDKEFIGSNFPNGLSDTDAVELRVYVKIRVNQRSKKIFSNDYIKLLIPELKDNVQWETDKIPWEVIENNRIRTIEK